MNSKLMTMAIAAGLLVASGDGGLRILEVQTEGKRRMLVQDFLAGHPLSAGDRFITT